MGDEFVFYIAHVFVHIEQFAIDGHVPRRISQSEWRNAQFIPTRSEVNDGVPARSALQLLGASLFALATIDTGWFLMVKYLIIKN